MTKILYGVQAGRIEHINRARVMAPKLSRAGFEVTYVFSGPGVDDLADMESFGDYIPHPGLNLFEETDGLNQSGTGRAGFPDLSGIDLVLCDNEPVTALVAKQQNKKVIGISHQYAYSYRIPRIGDDSFVRRFMSQYARVDMAIGLHWYHFNQPILPPIVETQCRSEEINERKIVVYLPFEDQATVIKLLGCFPEYDFHLFASKTNQRMRKPNVHIHAVSDTEMNAHFWDCGGVICDASIELATKALQAGKKLLVKPSSKQIEQPHNALILEDLEYAVSINKFSASILRQWLDYWSPVEIAYPDTAQAIVDWLKGGNWIIDMRWIESVWDSRNNSSSTVTHRHREAA